MRFGIILLITFLFGLISCGTTSPGIKTTSAPGLKTINVANQTIFLNGFSVVPPKQHGWHRIIKNTRGNSVSLVSKGDLADEKFSIVASKRQLPPFTNAEEFVSYIQGGFANQQSRSAFLEQSSLEEVSPVASEAVSTKHGVCVSAKSKAKDLSPERDLGITIPMFVEIISLTCQNPQNKSEAIDLVYAHKYDIRQKNPPLSDSARPFFESLEFDSVIKAMSDEVCL